MKNILKRLWRSSFKYRYNVTRIPASAEHVFTEVIYTPNWLGNLLNNRVNRFWHS